tara:strand:+ start:2715 stop:3014 length:300 start_codon:yes stop_codon:yes gene_type:complete
MKYSVIVLHTEQYADGITGQNHTVLIFNNSGELYRTKKDCKSKVSECKKKYKTVVTVKNEYGGRGNFYQIKIVTQEELNNLPYRYGRCFMEENKPNIYK